MSTATAVSTAATLESATTAAESATAGARLALLSFTDPQGTALQLGLIEGTNCVFCFFPVWHLNKPKPTGAACIAVQKNAGRLNFPILTECRTQFVVLNFVGEITDIYIH
jgi:hypothetical protein